MCASKLALFTENATLPHYDRLNDLKPVKFMRCGLSVWKEAQLCGDNVLKLDRGVDLNLPP